MYVTYGWNNYLIHEKSFLVANEYIDLVSNKTATSQFFTNQIVLLGSEIEAAFKKICLFNGVQAGNMSQYKEETLKIFPKVYSYFCVLTLNQDKYEPFANWSTQNGKISWWNVYTNIKHSTVNSTATVDVALTMLSALQILLFLIDAKNKKTPNLNGYYPVILFQQEIPSLFAPCFSNHTSLQTIGVLFEYHIPAKEVNV